MSRSQHRSNCHRSCKLCAWMRAEKSQAKTQRQLPAPDRQQTTRELRLLDFEEAAFDGWIVE